MLSSWVRRSLSFDFTHNSMYLDMGFATLNLRFSELKIMRTDRDRARRRPCDALVHPALHGLRAPLSGVGHVGPSSDAGCT